MSVIFFSQQKRNFSLKTLEVNTMLLFVSGLDLNPKV
jgi:hypothetical protein